MRKKGGSTLTRRTIAWIALVACLLMTSCAKDKGPVILFDSPGSHSDDNHQIYAMNVDGTNKINLSNNEFSDLQASASPDGAKIVFSSSEDSDSSSLYRIFIMNRDGSRRTKLTDISQTVLLGGEPNPLHTTVEGHPSFSPNGNRILFHGYRYAFWTIFVMNQDGSEAVMLTNQGHCREPSWSADGKMIVFSRMQRYEHKNYQIYIMHADGSNLTRITNNEFSDSAPAWSPDGKKIAYTSMRDDNYHIFVMNVDGSNQIQVTDELGGNWPSWSPDGSKIAYITGLARPQVYVVNWDGSGIKNLSNDEHRNHYPSWAIK